MCGVLKAFGCVKYLHLLSLAWQELDAKNILRQVFAEGELSHGEAECPVFKVRICLYPYKTDGGKGWGGMKGTWNLFPDPVIVVLKSPTWLRI